MARRGWRVVAVGVSGTALARGTKSARAAGVSNFIESRRHDLASTFPKGRCDFVLALFLHSPVEFPRTQVLRAAWPRRSGTDRRAFLGGTPVVGRPGHGLPGPGGVAGHRPTWTRSRGVAPCAKTEEATR